MTDKNKEPRKRIPIQEEDKELMADFQQKIKKALNYDPAKDCRDPKFKKESSI